MRTAPVVEPKAQDLGRTSECRGLQGELVVLYNVLPSEGAQRPKKTPKKLYAEHGIRTVRMGAFRAPLPSPSIGPSPSIYAKGLLGNTPEPLERPQGLYSG